MIEQQTVDGKPCIVAYFNDNFEACEPEEATLIKIIFEDGSNVFVTPQGLQEATSKEEAA